MTIQEKYQLWCEKVTDSELSNQLRTMTETEITNAFYKDLAFEPAPISPRSPAVPKARSL